MQLDNFHHCQRIHEFRHGHGLRNTGSVLSELEDEYDLHGHVQFSIVKCAVRGRLAKRDRDLKVLKISVSNASLSL